MRKGKKKKNKNRERRKARRRAEQEERQRARVAESAACRESLEVAMRESRSISGEEWRIAECMTNKYPIWYGYREKLTADEISDIDLRNERLIALVGVLDPDHIRKLERSYGFPKGRLSSERYYHFAFNLEEAPNKLRLSQEFLNPADAKHVGESQYQIKMWLGDIPRKREEEG